MNIRYLTILLIPWICCCSLKNDEKKSEPIVNESIKINDDLLYFPIQSDSIKKYSNKLKKYFTNSDPLVVAEKWLLPFDLHNRSDIKTIDIISKFGTYRSGYVKGHLHSGIDLIPSYKKDTIFVYPVNKGVICLIYPKAPNKTVIIKHKLKNNELIYSSYIHLKEIFVKNGEQVDYNTKIGVLYTKYEAKRFNGNYDHLHFEIKKRIDDYSCASWLCMNQKELNSYFENPSPFFECNLNK